MENNSTDWMAVQTQVGDASFADIYNLGVDPSSVTLDTKATYKDKKKIKENPAFLTNGKFDDKKFDQFYDMSVQTLNAYKVSDFSIGSGELPEMNLWEDTGLARALGQKTYKDPISIKTNTNKENNLRIAQKSNLGFIDLNTWSDPQKSMAEVAQGQKVIDGITGKELDFTPESASFGNGFGFFSDPLVLSSYDADIKDEKGNIVHKRGETKLDEKGLPRYETLAGRSASGKQILSRWDTLTKEDSYINKFDFMDSDDLNKSLGGSIVKAGVSILPLVLGGPVATAAKAYFIADGLLQAGTEIAKALTGIAGGKDADKSEFYKSLNNVQAFTKQWKGGSSENAKNNFFAAENIFNLASDSVYQLMGQQAIAQWPTRIKQYQMAKALNANPNLMTSLTKAGDPALEAVTKFETYIAKYGDDFGKAAAAMSRNVKQLENTRKISSYGATAFMSATSAVGISDVADQAGLNARDKGLLYLGLTAGLAPLFRANIGKWVEGGHEIDDIAKGMNESIKKYGSQYIKAVESSADEVAEAEAAKIAKESLTGLAKVKDRGFDMLIAGKKIGQRVASSFDNVTNPIKAGIAEGVEEVSEEMLQDSLKGIYNGLSALGLTSTDNKKIDFDMSDTMARYGQAFIGGAIGGMVFKFADPEVKVKSFISEDMKEYVANGFGNDLITRIKDMADKGQLPGSKTLSINRLTNADGILEDGVWAPVNADNPVSHSDFIADRMIKEVKANMAHMEAYGLDNPDMITDGKNKFYESLVDTRTDTDLRDSIRATSDKLVALSNEIKGIEDTEVNSPGIKKKKEEFAELQKRFEYLTSDESVDEYFRQGLFNISPEITTKFGVKDRDAFARELVDSKATYAKLNPEDKAKVDTAYGEYRLSNNDTFGMKVDLRNSRMEMETFDKEMEENGGYETIEKYKESLKTLTDYVMVGKGMVNGEATDYDLLTLSNEFYDQMKNVSYIPDFIHDEITKRLEDVKMNGLTKGINSVSKNNSLDGFNATTLKQTLLDNGIAQLQPGTAIFKSFKNYLAKTKGGLTVFDHPVYQELMNGVTNKNPDLSTMIKVLKEVDGIEDNSPEKAIYAKRNEAIANLTADDARMFLVQYARDNGFDVNIQGALIDLHPEIMEAETQVVSDELYQELSAMLDEGGYESILTDEEDPMFNGDEPLNFLRNLNANSFLNAATGEITKPDLNLLVEKPNIVLTHALEGTVNEMGMEFKALAEIDALVDDISGKMEAALKSKATSPLASFLANQYTFKNNEFESIYKNGPSNYLNQSEDYESTLDEHIAQTEKVAAYLYALNKLNPTINDWRAKNKDIVPEELRKEELTTLTPIEYSTIHQNANILLNELKYLKELNDFNKNNTLGKLLKEDSKQLSASFKTWSKLAQVDIVAQHLLSIEALLADSVVKEYVDDIDTGSDEQKIAALGAMAKHETAIFNEFSALTDADKLSIIDATFKPINATSADYRSNVRSDAPLSPEHQTLYLAKIFGSSSIEYTKAVAGESDGPGTYAKITASKMDPFPNQESAIRLAYLNRFGDPLVKRALAAAFAYRKKTDVTTYNRVSDAIYVDNTITVIGDPGVGKTKAIVAGILAFEEAVGDTVLLGAVDDHVKNLTDGVVNAGFEERINKELSSNVADFLNDLELVDNSNKLLTIDVNKPQISELIGKLKGISDKNDYESDYGYEQILKEATDMIMRDVKLWENDGTFNRGLTAKLKGVRNLVVDEFTHVHPVHLGVLSALMEAYNRSVNDDSNLKVAIILAGDNNQEGFEINQNSRTFGDFVQLPTSIPLTTSLRSGWDLINNTLVEVKDRTSRLNDMDDTELLDPATASNLRAIPIRLNYTTTGGKPIGMYLQSAEGETTAEHLKFFSDNIEAIKQDGSLVYIVDSPGNIPNAEALLRSVLGADWSQYAVVLTRANTQGREFKYAIVDANPIDSKSYKIKTTYKMLNTTLSRATEATLIIHKGQFADFATFVQSEAPKAIDQKKLTPEMITAIKANRQAITAAKLEGNVPTSAAPVSTPVQNQPPAELPPVNPSEIEEQPEETPTSDPEQPTPKEESKKPVDDATSVINDIPVLTSEDISALLNADAEAANSTTETSEEFVRTAPYMVNAYTSLTFKRDTDAVNTLLAGTVSDPIKAEAALLPLKEYVIYGREELGTNYLGSSELMNELTRQGYKPRNMAVRMRAIKRNSEFVTVGRAKWKNDHNERQGEDMLILEGSIPNPSTGVPFVYTVGTFNSLGNILSKGGDTESVKNFVSTVKAALAANQSWQSPEFSMAEWKQMYARKEFKVQFDPSANNSLAEVRQNYNQNMTITDSQVVISKINSNEANDEIWKALTGNSISFATEHPALRGKSATDLYNIYKEQLRLYNNDEYAKMNYNEKEAYIARQNKIPGTNLAPRPRLVSMIKVTNPTHNFTEFITNYNIAIYNSKKAKASGQRVNFAEEVRNFEMSPYVADRLVKSMLVLHQFLTDENSVKNKEWFEANVVPKTKSNVLNKIDAYMAQTKAEFASEGMPIDFGNLTASDFIDNESDALAIKTTDDLVEALEKYLFDNPTLVRGSYSTSDKTPNKVKGEQLDPNVNLHNILPTELTTDKRKDFSNGKMLSVKNLSIYNGLKPSFLSMINESLIALGSIPTNDPNLGKYSLTDVFKDGKIENIIVAGVGQGGRQVGNVIAPIVKTSLTSGFKTNIKSVQSAGFFVDFDKMMTKIGDPKITVEESAEDRAKREKAESVNTDIAFGTWLNGFGVQAWEYQIDPAAYPNTMEEFETIKKNGFKANLNDLAKVININAYHTFDSLNPDAGKFSSNVPQVGILDQTIQGSDVNKPVVVTTEYADRIETRMFNREQGFNEVVTVVYKDNGVFNANDEAKRLIDKLGITKESIIEAGKVAVMTDPKDYALDYTPMKGQKTAVNGVPHTVIGSAIGPSGSIWDSNVLLINDVTGERLSGTQHSINPAANRMNLPVHRFSEAKAIAFANDLSNIDIEAALSDIVRSQIDPTNLPEKDAIVAGIMSQLEINEVNVPFDPKSTYAKINEMIIGLGDIIRSPFTRETEHERDNELYKAYVELAKGAYADKLHTTNGFINNFSIFANGQADKYQLIIDNALKDDSFMDNGGTKKLLELEKQLNKITHDC